MKDTKFFKGISIGTFVETGTNHPTFQDSNIPSYLQRPNLGRCMLYLLRAFT